MTQQDNHSENRSLQNKTQDQTSALGIVLNFLRGCLIGSAELVPGISGGTIAIITGVYERIIFNAHAFLHALKDLFSDRKKAIKEIKALDWNLLLPLATGMILIIFALSGPIVRITTEYFVNSRSLFFGMVLASVAVPILMISKDERTQNLKTVISGFAIGLVLGLVFTGLSRGEQPNPPFWLIFIAAAIAVCALVMPGVSGSFFLLAIGIYEATLTAVSDLNFSYLGVFLLGAVTGILLFINALNWLLHNKRTATLAVGSGLLLGSVRALWPWQEKLDSGIMRQIAPNTNLTLPILLMILGFILVAVLVVVDMKLSHRKIDEIPEDITVV